MKKKCFPLLACIPLMVTAACVDMDSMDDLADDFDQNTSAMIAGQPVYPSGSTMSGLVAKRVAKKVNFWGKKEIVPEFNAFNVSNADTGVLFLYLRAEYQRMHLWRVRQVSLRGRSPLRR